jgi:hypothetical protein
MPRKTNPKIVHRDAEVNLPSSLRLPKLTYRQLWSNRQFQSLVAVNFRVLSASV